MKINKTFYYALFKGIFESLTLEESYIVDIQLPEDIEKQLLDHSKKRTHKAEHLAINSYGFLTKSMDYFLISYHHAMGSGPMYINIKTLEIKDSPKD